jgi:hypothetical protein
MMQLCTKVKNLLKERLENREIYIAIGGLSDSELNTTASSLPIAETTVQGSLSLSGYRNRPQGDSH